MAEQLELGKEDKPATVAIDAKELEALKLEREALKTQLQTAALQQARLEEQAKAASEAKAAPAAPVLTMEQLQTALDNGQITESQMKEEVTRQLRDQLKIELSKEFDQKNAANQQKNSLQSQFDQYVALRPDVVVAGSDDLRRVQTEIQQLQKLGYTHDLRTEIVAMRTVFGPLDRVQETTKARRQSHQETGGSSDRGKGQGGAASWEKGLTDVQVSTYRKLADRAYNGEEDPMFQRVTTRLRNKNQSKGAA